MTSAKRLLLGSALISVAAVQAGWGASPAGTVHLTCNLSAPSGVQQPLTLAAQIYRVTRDDYGNYSLQGRPEILYVNLAPGAQSDAAHFDATIELGDKVEYEFKVVALNSEGYERTDGAYYFVSQDPKGSSEFFDNSVPLRPGEDNQVYLSLRWMDQGAKPQSNFVQISQRKGHQDYTMSLYTNDGTQISLLK